MNKAWTKIFSIGVQKNQKKSTGEIFFIAENISLKKNIEDDFPE